MLSASLATAACAFAGGAQPAAPAGEDRRPELAWLVENCDRIVLGEVVAIRELALEESLPSVPPSRDGRKRLRRLRVLDVRADDVVWGPPELKRIAVLDEPSASFLDAGAPVVVGERAYWIVERAVGFWTDDDAHRDALAHAAGTRDLETTLSNGAGRLRIEGTGSSETVCLPTTLFREPALPVVSRHESRKPNRSWADVRREDFDAWVRSTVRSLVPSVRAEFRWTAPGAQPRVVINADGSSEVISDGSDGASDAVLDRDVLARIVEVARQQRFLDLPPWVGHSRGPCSGGLRVRIRTEHGSRVVRVSGSADLRRDGPAELDALARARAVLDAIPVARAWRYGD